MPRRSRLHYAAAVLIPVAVRSVPRLGLGNEGIAPKTTLVGTVPVTCRERLGGVLKFYYRDAA